MNVVGVVAAGVGVGALSGLLGIGGGVVLVPILVFAFALSQKPAQATSLAAITLISVAGATSYGLAGDVQWVPALVVVAGGFAGSMLGAELAHRMSERQLKWIFAGLMIIVAIRMAWASPVAGAESLADLGLGIVLGYIGAGLLMGLLSALVGIGGGIVIVPLLILAFGFTPHEAQGTSLAVMAPVAAMGAWRLARHGYTDWRAGALLGAGGIVGAPLGTLVALAIPGTGLQRIFAVFLVYSAIQLIRKARRSAVKGPA